jgi:hypothetical protein
MLGDDVERGATREEGEAERLSDDLHDGGVGPDRVELKDALLGTVNGHAPGAAAHEERNREMIAPAVDRVELSLYAGMHL